MKHLKIEYTPSYLDDKYQAVAVNIKNHKRFIIYEYTSIDKAVKLAPIALERKIKNPSSEFKMFML